MPVHPQKSSPLLRCYMSTGARHALDLINNRECVSILVPVGGARSSTNGVISVSRIGFATDAHLAILCAEAVDVASKSEIFRLSAAAARLGDLGNGASPRACRHLPPMSSGLWWARDCIFASRPKRKTRRPRSRQITIYAQLFSCTPLFWFI
jgi:hypothetical protein